MAVTTEQSAPYAPASKIVEIIQRYRTHGLLTPITKDVLSRVGVTDSLIPRTLQALQVLDLIDEAGNPSDTLERIRVARETEYKERIEEWLKGAYAEVFAFANPAKKDVVAIRDAFRSYNPISQQPRMVALFLGLCVEAGIRDKTTTRSRAQQTTQRSSPRKQTSQSGKTRHGFGNQVPRPIATFLEDNLPSDEGNWTEASKNKFLQMFELLLDYHFDVTDDKPSEKSNESNTGVTQ